MPALADLNRWQRDGLACALGGGLLFQIPRVYRLGAVYDAEGYGYDLLTCEPCLREAFEKAVADAS